MPLFNLEQNFIIKLFKRHENGGWMGEWKVGKSDNPMNLKDKSKQNSAYPQKSIN